MSAVKIAVSALSLAIAASRHPMVRAGVQAAANNPRARAVAMETAKAAAYNAGVIARHVVGRKTT
jgi:hypothetical protein